MAAGNAIVYLDTAANRETASGCGIPFQHSSADLQAKLQQLISSPEMVEAMRREAANTARELYDWQHVVDKYEALFLSLHERR
jgi:glycosyltransferase involved in cell wall biosynthesis